MPAEFIFTELGNLSFKFDYGISQLNREKILIADDNSAIIDALQIVLQGEGYDVSSTIEPKKIKNMAKKHPDLLLLDIRMPGYDGREICRDLKNYNDTSDIPIILISANNNSRESLEQAGADCFIAKPFEMRDLLDKVEYHINQHN